MHVGMRIGFVGVGMRKTRDSREWKCEWALQGGGMRKTSSWEWEWMGMGMAEHGMGQPTPYRLNR
jgi:hypothetical protein